MVKGVSFEVRSLRPGWRNRKRSAGNIYDQCGETVTVGIYRVVFVSIIYVTFPPW